MNLNHIPESLQFLSDTFQLGADFARIVGKEKLKDNIKKLAYVSALGAAEEKIIAQHLIRQVALEYNVFPASIHELYMARGRGEVPFTFSVPAMNLRILSFHAARMIFRCAKQMDATAMIFEIARSEMGYTDQRPAEYVASVLAAAVAEGHRGPVFIQGDHFQVSSKKYATDPDVEITTLKNLILEAVNAGFYNIDIDASTLVDLEQKNIPAQQENNFKLTELLCCFIRENQPDNLTVSVGGEIGEVGGHNSTEEELRAYLEGFNNLIKNKKIKGLSKISVQTGTSHGGVVLPDGSIAAVNLDFDTLRNLSRIARKDYGLGGTVQHGASTLPENAFGKFVEAEAMEVHLATSFANIFFDLIPDTLLREMYHEIDNRFANERKSDMTDDQFYYKMRKNIIGSFKKQCWELDAPALETIENAWLTQYNKLFHHLGIAGTRKWTEKYIEEIKIRPILGSNMDQKSDSEASKLSD